MWFFFMVTIASSSQLAAVSEPLDATLSAQIIPHTIELQTPPSYKGEMDYKDIETWIYSVENYFALNGLTDPSQ